MITDAIDGKNYIVIAVEPGTSGPYQTSDKAENDKEISLKAGRYQLPEHLTIVINSEVPQEYIFYVTTEEIAPVLPSELENPNEEITSEGEQWVASLDYDEPKLVVFNDETGVNTVIEDGSSYQMQAGDQMAVYLPYVYAIRSISSSNNSYEIELKEGFVLVNYVDDGTTNIQLEVINTELQIFSYEYEILSVN